MPFQILPPKRPQQPREKTVRMLLDAGMGQYDDKVVLLGVRGYYRDTMGVRDRNDRKLYDDAMFVVDVNGSYGAFNANCDPGAFRKGIANLVPGCHPYRKGLHGISRKNPYPALRPATAGERLPVVRDGQEGVTSGVAINIHKGSRLSVSSEGCQTIWPGQWDEFITLVYSLMDLHQQTRIPYYLVEIPDLTTN